MSYVGTGTETDPYVVTNLTDLLTCIKQSDSYVKVGADIDAEDDENYTGELTSSIYVACRKLYSDDDEPKTIRGITVTDTMFMKTSTDKNEITIKNVSFLDCSHKLTTAINTSIAFIGRYSGTKITKIENCNISGRVIYSEDASYVIAHEHVNFLECAIDFDMLILYNNTRLFDGTLEKCNIIIRNLKIKHYDRLLFTTVTRSAILLIDAYYNTNRINLSYTNTTFSYFAFINLRGNEPLSVIIKNGHNVLVTSESTIESELDYSPIYSVTNGTLVTPDQLRNKEYLTDIGFLP